MPENSADRAGGHPRSRGLTPLIRIPVGLVLLVGPPASGKTSFVRALVEQGRIGAEAVVSSDDIRTELFGAAPEPADVEPADVEPADSDGEDPAPVGPDAADSDAADARIFDERDRRITARLADGLVVIAESTNVTPRARERLHALARRFGAPVTVLRFAPETAELLQQYAERGRTDLTEADVRAYAAVMSRDAGADRLRSEGADAVHEVPGRRQSVTPAEAAARFVVGRGAPGGS
ncbi:ATP-binding protein [Streptomyces californicus]|uniref:ATP-binding protein n=1 Tax=Streptomyces californicus TaxID=67351 RepID=UPI00296F356C|nr:ATP-binding protein [Streptomyces californicus]MDW4917457.1 ATP-binding protein [Streptomyces californicus]